MSGTSVDKCKELVRHLLRRLTDDPEFIECSGKLTRTYELLLDAAVDLFGEPRDLIEKQILGARREIESYRPLVSFAVRYRNERDAARQALSEIAEGYMDGDAARQIAREAL